MYIFHISHKLSDSFGLLFIHFVASFFALFDLRCFGMSILPLSVENSKQYEKIMYTKIEGENCAKLLIEIGR